MNPRAQLKPGWLTSEGQHSLLWTLWAAACEYQGWNALPSAQREEKRREILVDLGFQSAKHIDATDGFDRVKAKFEALAGQVHNERPDEGLRRRIAARIRQAMCELIAVGYASHSIETILRERFHVIDGVNTITDLTTPELLNFLRTLTARLATCRERRQPDPAQANHLQPPCTARAECLPGTISKTTKPSQIALFG